MDLILLQAAVAGLQQDLETAITSGSYDGRQSKKYAHGLEAKTALIRSQGLIMRLHEVVKQSLAAELIKTNQTHTLYPSLGQTSPELSLTGYIKAKKQDVVVLFGTDIPQHEPIAGGPLDGMTDKVGKAQSERAIVIGVRSQLSSVNKNFDTLMERALAEALNFHLRHPRMVMGEVYLLPVFEYDPKAMQKNMVSFLPNQVDIEKFIRTFFGISGRNWNATTVDEEVYKYERTALLLVDFRQHPPKIYLTREELQTAGLVSERLKREITDLSPQDFAADIVDLHKRRHTPPTELTTDIEPDSVYPIADRTA